MSKPEVDLFFTVNFLFISSLFLGYIIYTSYDDLTNDARAYFEICV